MAKITYVADKNGKLKPATNAEARASTFAVTIETNAFPDRASLSSIIWAFERFIVETPFPLPTKE